jgi:hypothetical protein
MKEKTSSIGMYITVVILIIILTLLYLYLPKSWSNMGDTYKPRTVDKSGGPTPTSLQFKNPFKYDNYKPSKRVEPQQPTGNGEEKKPTFWNNK